MTADIGERIQKLIIILVQGFGEPIAVPQVIESADLDVGQPARRRTVGIVDSRNAQLRGERLPREKRLRCDLITRVADFHLVNLSAGKRMYVTQPGHQRLVVDVLGEGASACDYRKWIGFFVVHVAIVKHAEEAVLRTNLVVDPDIERILIVAVHWIEAKQKALSRGDVRLREECDNFLRRRIKARSAGGAWAGRNHVGAGVVISHKLFARYRVKNFGGAGAGQKIGKVSVNLCWVGHG